MVQIFEYLDTARIRKKQGSVHILKVMKILKEESNKEKVARSVCLNLLRTYSVLAVNAPQYRKSLSPRQMGAAGVPGLPEVTAKAYAMTVSWKK